MSVLYNSNTRKLNNSAIMWGKLHESTAFECYKPSFFSYTMSLVESGLIISDVGFLAASLDGFYQKGKAWNF